jgi:MoaA/NifB/PqqE/SkfB family radical SAM enzyme
VAQERRGPGTSAVLGALLLRLATRHPAFLGTRLTVRATVDSGNVGHLSSSFESLVALGVRNFVPSPVNTPDPGWNDDAASKLDAELGKIADASLGLDPAGGRFAFSPFRRLTLSGSPLSGPVCSLGAPDVLFVDVDGRIAPCGAFAASVHPALPALAEAVRRPLRGARVSDARLDERLARRWRAASRLPALHAARDRRSARGSCASCEALAECAVCPAAIASAPEQDPDLVPAVQCDWNRLVARHRRAYQRRLAAPRPAGQRAGRSSSAAATSAVTPVRIDGP